MKALESSSPPPQSLVDSFLAGEAVSLHLREALDHAVCAGIADRYWASPATHPREDGVPGSVLGAYHFGKDLATYLDEVVTTGPDVAAVLGRPDPVHLALRYLAESYARSQTAVRLAEHEGRPAAPARALSWSAPGPYLLEPPDRV
jgi:hypothetical protein